MDHEGKTAAEEQANAEEIEDLDATQAGPRGNVHSEPDEEPPFDGPPPLPA